MAIIMCRVDFKSMYVSPERQHRPANPHGVKTQVFNNNKVKVLVSLLGAIP
jgi:hypothetical protein